VHFIFQPAEEGLGGAKAMIDDGLFERFPCDAIFGMHNRPKLAVGRFAVRAGPMMAGGAFFDIRITGRGAHGARPETGVDARWWRRRSRSACRASCRATSRRWMPPCCRSRSIHAGDAYNVIPQTATLGGTVRAFSRDVMPWSKRDARVAEGTAAAFGAAPRSTSANCFAPTVNDPEQAEFAARICTELVGADNVDRNPPLIMASRTSPSCSSGAGLLPQHRQRRAPGGEAAARCTTPPTTSTTPALPLGAAFFVRPAVQSHRRSGG
jgi:amidohydrolase